ncbi:MAG TPA: N-acetylmuramoyl-L-alanine amidase [Thermoanaerobaculia bacterium]
MKDRRIWASLGVLCLVLPVLVAAQGERPQPPPVPAAPPAGSRASVTLEGREIPVPVTINPSGPMFGLSPLVEALGGKLTSDVSGESVTLRVADTDVVLGPGNAIVTVGDTIVSLSQPPAPGEGGLQVPVDFLRKTYGDLLGYAFEWHPETQGLTIARRGNRELGVALDVVHLQGMTTVVLQFPEEPSYRINREQPGMIVVEMLSDRLTPPPPREVEDPLVESVAIEPQQIRIQLAAGVQAASYVLADPFRLVFDVHPTSSVEVPTGPAVPRETAPGIRTIVIDPGHGGTETGAIGPSGVPEKELTLQLSRELASKIAQRVGARVVLTRYDDATLPLDTRTAIANQNQGDLFISVHLNSSLGSGAFGTETYFLSPQATDARAARAAQAENAGNAGAAGKAPATPATTGEDAAAQQDLQLILWDLAQSHHMAESQRFANLVQGELNQTLQLKDRGVKQAPFRVLMGATMPAVLVELGFVSNPEEEKKLKDPAYRDQLVDALARAVARYKALVEHKPEPVEAAPGAAQAPQPPGAQPPAAPTAPAPGAPPPAKPPANPAKKTDRPA